MFGFFFFYYTLQLVYFLKVLNDFRIIALPAGDALAEVTSRGAGSICLVFLTLNIGYVHMHIIRIHTYLIYIYANCFIAFTYRSLYPWQCIQTYFRLLSLVEHFLLAQVLFFGGGIRKSEAYLLLY